MSRRRFLLQEVEGRTLATMQIGDYYYSDGTISPEIIANKTPLGICVIPANHLDDGWPRIIGLVDIDSSGLPTTMNNATHTVEFADEGVGVGYGVILRSTILPITLDNYTYDHDWSQGTVLIGTSKPYTNMNSQYYDLYYGSLTGNKVCCPYLPNGTPNPDYGLRGYATSDFNGWINTQCMLSGLGNAGWACSRYHPTLETQGHWYLPALGELGYVVYNVTDINEKIEAVGGYRSNTCWSSTEYDEDNSWAMTISGGSIIKSTNPTKHQVRPFLAVWTL